MKGIENKSLPIINLQKFPDENEILSKLTPKQGKSYLILKNNQKMLAIEDMEPQKLNKLRSNLGYYEKLLENK